MKRGLYLVAKDSIDVASAVQHSHDIDAAIDGYVEVDVPPEREAASIGRIQAVFGDAISDVEDVGRPRRSTGDARVIAGYAGHAGLRARRARPSRLASSALQAWLGPLFKPWWISSRSCSISAARNREGDLGAARQASNGVTGGSRLRFQHPHAACHRACNAIEMPTVVGRRGCLLVPV